MVTTLLTVGSHFLDLHLSLHSPGHYVDCSGPFLINSSHEHSLIAKASISYLVLVRLKCFNAEGAEGQIQPLFKGEYLDVYSCFQVLSSVLIRVDFISTSSFSFIERWYSLINVGKALL